MRSGGSCHLCSPNTCGRLSGGSSHEDRSQIPNIKRSSSTEVSWDQQREDKFKQASVVHRTAVAADMRQKHSPSPVCSPLQGAFTQAQFNVDFGNFKHGGLSGLLSVYKTTMNALSTAHGIEGQGEMLKLQLSH